ncbi:MAG: Crp/Fnr family transcriptional regulator [Bacteroidota bacterium]
MKQIEVKKGTVIQSVGEVDTKVYHVKSGLLRSYSIDEKGKEHIFMFAPEGWTIGDSVSSGEKAELFIDTLENSIVIEVEKNPEKEKQNIKPILKRVSVLQKRIIMLMSSSALERYEHFVKTYPDITQRVSQKMIASYLGITPEALSKIKNKKINNS